MNILMTWWTQDSTPQPNQRIWIWTLRQALRIPRWMRSRRILSLFIQMHKLMNFLKSSSKHKTRKTKLNGRSNCSKLSASQPKQGIKMTYSAYNSSMVHINSSLICSSFTASILWWKPCVTSKFNVWIKIKWCLTKENLVISFILY